MYPNLENLEGFFLFNLSQPFWAKLIETKIVTANNEKIKDDSVKIELLKIDQIETERREKWKKHDWILYS